MPGETVLWKPQVWNWPVAKWQSPGTNTPFDSVLEQTVGIGELSPVFPTAAHCTDACGAFGGWGGCPQSSALV